MHVGKPIIRPRNQGNAEIARKLCGKLYFRIRKSTTKFHVKVRKPHFKLRKEKEFKKKL